MNTKTAETPKLNSTMQRAQLCQGTDPLVSLLTDLEIYLGP